MPQKKIISTLSSPSDIGASLRFGEYYEPGRSSGTDGLPIRFPKSKLGHLAIDAPYRGLKTTQYGLMSANVMTNTPTEIADSDLAQSARVIGIGTGLIIIGREATRVNYARKLHKFGAHYRESSDPVIQQIGEKMQTKAKEDGTWGTTRIVGGVSNTVSNSILIAKTATETASTAVCLAGLILGVIGDGISCLKSAWDFVSHSIQAGKAIYRRIKVAIFIQKNKIRLKQDPELKAITKGCKNIANKQIRNNILNATGQVLMGAGRIMMVLTAVGVLGALSATPIGWALFGAGAALVIGLLIYKYVRSRRKKRQIEILTHIATSGNDLMRQSRHLTTLFRYDKKYARSLLEKVKKSPSLENSKSTLATAQAMADHCRQLAEIAQNQILKRDYNAEFLKLLVTRLDEEAENHTEKDGTVHKLIRTQGWDPKLIRTDPSKWVFGQYMRN